MPAGDGPIPLARLPTYGSASKARLKALYSDFSKQKASNPASYRSNVDWWKNTLTDLASRGLQSGPAAEDVLVLSVSSDLLEQLRYEGVGKPLCLGAVLVRLVPKVLMRARTYVHYT